MIPFTMTNENLIMHEQELLHTAGAVVTTKSGKPFALNVAWPAAQREVYTLPEQNEQTSVQTFVATTISKNKDKLNKKPSRLNNPTHCCVCC